MSAGNNPVTEAWLRQFLLDCRHGPVLPLPGAQYRRQIGQSLEFFDYATYVPGDDIRRVDWATSYRTGDLDHLQVRRFVAEQSLQLVVTVHFAPSLNGPRKLVTSSRQYQEPLSKRVVACWLAEALGGLALQDGHRFILHAMAPHSAPPRVFNGIEGKSRLVSELRRLCSSTATADELVADHLDSLDRWLPPTAVWVVISDFYSKAALQGALARRIAEAQRGYRFVIAVDLDSWPAESAQLSGYVHADGPGVAPEEALEYFIEPAAVAVVEQEIASHKRAFFDKAKLRRSQVSDRWHWERVPSLSHVDFFRREFVEDRLLRSVWRPRAAV